MLDQRRGKRCFAFHINRGPIYTKGPSGKELLRDRQHNSLCHLHDHVGY